MDETRLSVNLASWIIQDGNYDDFACGQQRDFALEFLHDDAAFRTGSERTTSFRCLDDSSLEVTAKVVVCTDSWYAIDFGVRALREHRPPDAMHLGQVVHGRVTLGIDPFFYMEYLHRDEMAVPMIYSWRIDRIRMQTAPFVESNQVVSPTGAKPLVRDPSCLGWEVIRTTNAWKDDSGDAEYLLDITLIDPEPKRKCSQ
jgi:hypothetical protein